MKTCLATLALLGGMACADNVRYRGETVQIKFDEPVVPQSVCQNGWNDAAPAADRGLDLFDITGDAAHQPKVRWVDQNLLQIEFVEGTSCATEYRLSFRPGCGKYLGQAAMPKTSFTFQHPKTRLEAASVPGLDAGAFVVRPARLKTKEEQSFSQNSGVTYVYEQVIQKEYVDSHGVKRFKTERGAKVPATLSPVQIKHGLGYNGLERLKLTKPDWSALTPESLQPQAVLVQPQSPLPEGTRWELRSNGGAGFVDDSRLNEVHQVKHGLETWAGAGYADGLKVSVAFGAEVTVEEAERAWRDMEISMGGAKAAASADGKSKTLTVNGGECRITFEKLVKPEAGRTPRPYARPVEVDSEDAEPTAPTPVEYVPQGVAQGFILKVEGRTPATLDFVVPEGIVTYLGGRKTQSPQRHRLSLNPAWPVLEGARAPYINMVAGNSRGTSVALLPLNGEHKLRVPLVNADGLTATAYRVPGDKVATQSETLRTAVQEDGTAREIVRLQTVLERHARKVKEMDAKSLARTKKDLDKLRKQEINPTAHKFTRDLTPGAELAVDVPAGDNANLATVEAVLDMDALLGGKAAPGIYLVRLKSRAYPSVRQTLREINLPESLLDVEQFVLVQITDLNVAYSSDVVLVNRLSDGRPVETAKVTPYICQTRRGVLSRNSEPVMVKKADATEVCNGCALMEPIFGEGSGGYCLLVEHGDDYTVIGQGYGEWSQNARTPEYRSLLQTDRKLYRPGETVHVRGVLRCVSPEGVASLPVVSTVNFRVRRPDGKDLVNKQVTLDASGGIDESFVLPDGEEDVTGGYSISLTSPDHRYQAHEMVQAEIFRRDSFKLTSELTVDPIAPKEFTFTLKAVDLNGTPVSGGKATLDISSSVALLSFQGGKQNVTVEADAKRNPSTNINREFKLDAEGKIELKGGFAAFKPRDFGGIRISGSVANDREEYVRFNGDSADFYPADFLIDFDNRRGRIELAGVGAKGEAVTPLAREQKLHVTLHYTARTVETRPNGFVFVDSKPAVLREEDVTVPASCHEGLVWDARKMWEEFSQKNENAGSDPHVVISGTDPEGRCVESEYSVYLWDRGGEDNEVQVADSDSCKLGEDGQLHITTTCLRQGPASVVVMCDGKARTVVKDVVEGTQEIVLPTVPGEEGRACVAVFLPHPDASGVFTRYESHSCSVTLPSVKYALQTQVNVPKDAVLPGTAITLDGQVTKDGKGAPATVTLFAVDEGMLTLSRYSVKNLQECLSGRNRFYNLDFSTHVTPWGAGDSDFRRRGYMGGVSMIPGIWVGEDMAPEGGMVYAGALSRDASYKVRASKAVAVNGMQACGAGMDSDDDCVMECAVMDCDAAPAPAPCMAPARMEKNDSLDMGLETEEGVEEEAAAPRLRTNFQPVAVWQGVLKTDAEGRFSTTFTLPDTLTTYKVYAMVLGDDGKCFSNAEESFTVNQPLMLTPGTPLFMSTGDTLRLPLTVTNNTDAEGVWTVTISSAKEPQKVTIPARGTATIYFDFTATEEGETTLDWTAKGAKSSDAVQGSFPVRFPAPLLKEAHHLVLAPGTEKKLADLLAPELATSSRGEVEVHMSANPLLHLVGCMDYLLEYPYGCTEQTASGLLPWLFYDRLAPLSPMLAETPADKVHEVIAKSIETLFKRQLADGGLGYWGDSRESSGWASAHAALVLTIAQEQGHGALIPQDKMEKLRTYLRGYLAELRNDHRKWDAAGPMTLFALGRVLGDDKALDAALGLADARNEENRTWGCLWHRDIGADLTLIRALRKEPAKKHDAFLQWMRARGHDYRHTTTLRSGWMLIALHEYLRLTPASTKEATVQLQDGTTMVLNQGVTILKPQAKPLSALPTVLKAVQGEVYVTFKAKAQPNQTEYPGVVEKGLQITRIYEKKGADGIWREAKEFATGDVVRVTLTCAKSAPELEYFVLEDYLPSCMEAINPNVPSQAAGLEWSRWSHWFDHKEYLADRVRGFCTRWGGRDLLNMTYYARVKRSGTTMAPPAQAQLMYEPQTYGLSPNTRIQSK